MIPDPLLLVRDLLLVAPDITRLVGDQIFATPLLPKEHKYPLIKLQHIGSGEYANVGFRQSLTALIQMDIWGPDHGAVRWLAEVALSELHDRPPAGYGLLSIRPSSEVADIDETTQPPLYHYRADLQVRVANMPLTATP